MMYKPKDSSRWHPRVSLPIRLDDQCLNVVSHVFMKTAEKVRARRNSREKKALRDFITSSIPAVLQQRILQKCLAKLVGVQTSLNLLEIFQPGKVTKNYLDLIGPFRLGFGCYLKGGRLTWSQGSAKKFNLNKSQLDQLYNLLVWSSPSELKELSISVARDMISLSKLPNLLGQAKQLTRVTILSGAENLTLRVLGLNCPCLVLLDVSHSIRVTDHGLRYLFLRHLTQKQNRETERAALSSNFDDNEEAQDIVRMGTNACAKSIACVILVGTSVTWAGCNLACKLMNFGYLTASLPFMKIVRVNKRGLRVQGLRLTRDSLSFVADEFMDEEKKDVIMSSSDNTLPLDELQTSVIDFFTLTNASHPGKAPDSLVFVRDNKDSFKMQLHLRMESSHVTSLTLPWYTFTWRLDSLVDVDTIGMCFPNLKCLKGRIKGRWTRYDEPFLPELQAAYVWSLNSSTALSIIQNNSSMKYLEFNNTQTLPVQDTSLELNDKTLEDSLTKNQSLANKLESFTIRPAHLTLNALKCLTSRCPNLKRLGDLESWSITSEEIGRFNQYLDAQRSQCVLTIMNFPPEPTENHFSWVF